MTRASFLVQDYLIDSARRLPDKVALVCDRRRYTYRELAAHAQSLAHALARRGVERGDRVVVFADNSAETAIAFWGVLEANAIVSIVNPQTKLDKLVYLLEDCRARVVITEARLAAVVADAVRRTAHVSTIVIAGRLDARAQQRLAGLSVVLWDDAVADDHEAPRRRCIDVDLASIIYTSGSTGEPKGVMLTHRNMLAACESIREYLQIAEDEVILDVLPLAFDYGLYQMIMAFAAGARLVLERSFAFPREVLRVVVEERITGFPGVPTMFAVLADMNLADYDFSAIRYVTNTAAALPVKHITKLLELFPAARIYSMYGLTECKRCTYLPPQDIRRKPESVGIAIPNTELWLVDEHDNRLGPGQIGQLVIRGATVMKGYWEKPELTAKKLRPGPVAGEHVLYTGDLCRLDEDGYLYFVGRMDDIIKSRGEKVAPKEVEAAIVDIAGVREAAVIGVPDEMLGQAIKAFVVLDACAALDAAAIQRECRARLESFMVPKYIEIVAELAKGMTGKIQKTGLT